MGYSHYMFQRGMWSDARVRAAIRDMVEIVRRCEIPLAGPSGDPNTVPLIRNLSIRFNGVGPDSHEEFWFGQGCTDPDSGFWFCKTAEKPYDVVVAACLLAAKHHLGRRVEISSDGDWEYEWSGAAEVYNHTFPDRAPVRPPFRLMRSHGAG